MIGSNANLSTGGYVAETAAVPGLSSGLAAVVSVSRFEPPAPHLALSYTGRVGTFYNASTETYSESYEPARLSADFSISRIESRRVSGQWRHIAYNASGLQVFCPEDHFLLFDQTTLPLMFDPDLERAFALNWLSSNAGSDVINLPRDLMVYGSWDRLSVGIIRLKLNMSLPSADFAQAECLLPEALAIDGP